MDNSVQRISVTKLVAKTWKVIFNEETYIYTAYYQQEDGRLVNESMRDEYGYEIVDATLAETIFDYWCSQDNSVEVSP
jgi:hypothetical protein